MADRNQNDSVKLNDGALPGGGSQDAHLSNFAMDSMRQASTEHGAAYLHGASSPDLAAADDTSKGSAHRRPSEHISTTDGTLVTAPTDALPGSVMPDMKNGYSYTTLDGGSVRVNGDHVKETVKNDTTTMEFPSGVKVTEQGDVGHKSYTWQKGDGDKFTLTEGHHDGHWGTLKREPDGKEIPINKDGIFIDGKTGQLSYTESISKHWGWSMIPNVLGAELVGIPGFGALIPDRSKRLDAGSGKIENDTNGGGILGHIKDLF